MVCGSLEAYDRFVARYVDVTGVPFLSVDYRLAPEFPGTTLVDDSHIALVWLVDHAEQLGIDADRIAVMGDSGGGGVAAGVAIAARDAGTPLAKQILMNPMLDDRNLEPDAELAPFALWTYDNNYTGWHALLGDDLGTDGVSPLAAPSRLKDFRGLAPAFIDVGEIDIFRDENILYALGLLRAGVSCELYVRAGSLHGFDRLAPEARVAMASWDDRCRAIKAI
ncbi:alpha/beta hydrolase fold domain-containing protein [Arthrobacter sp. ISL-95]|uniref:alpha/beta hydrolase fold domain-containing protein n=1 Tax=Arthrobacter sp. ISL-95 TaxID=2819116 RepID=UPI001BE87DD0|nr:alpha/beta hydrolase fold domain-containing protein [Arthrobacter sp. ISL-95]MBT2587817.1 alpha/beta hydrolase fold domain-containing protein [Arthrobacter sp. ISL-95]